MKIKIRRYHPDFEPKSIYMEYSIDSNKTLLENLNEIKQKIDATLTFTQGCRSGVCGSCAVKVNSKEVLACEVKVKEGDVVEPLSVVEVIRDLVVDFNKSLNSLKRAKAYLSSISYEEISEEDERLIQKQSDCILCHSCYSSCVVYETNMDFLGPFALTRAYRYIMDKREKNKKEIVDSIVKDGIYDCTLCGNCTEVCPMGIDPKNDILMLQSIAAKYGYSNPNMSSFGSFGLEF
jgi:fumarate reductase iron-sulfur subunit